MIEIEHGVGAERVPSIGMSYRCTMLCYFILLPQKFTKSSQEATFAFIEILVQI
jgi:hypothetical protein